VGAGHTGALNLLPSSASNECGRAYLTHREEPVRIRFTLGLVGSVFGLMGLALVLAGHRAPGVATASQHSDQMACMDDAITICGQFIPDRERVAGCLISNRSNVSAVCRSALTHFDPQTASAH
jgi:hypothetical protein